MQILWIFLIKFTLKNRHECWKFSKNILATFMTKLWNSLRTASDYILSDNCWYLREGYGHNKVSINGANVGLLPAIVFMNRFGLYLRCILTTEWELCFQKITPLGSTRYELLPKSAHAPHIIPTRAFIHFKW